MIDAAKGVAAHRPRDPGPAAGLRRGRTGRHRRAGRHDRRPPEVNVHIVTGSQNSTQNIVACVNRAGVNVAETVVTARRQRIRADRRQRIPGGAGRHRRRTTDIAIYERGSMAHRRGRCRRRSSRTTSQWPARRCPTRQRSRHGLRCRHGDETTMEVASVGGRKPRVMARRIFESSAARRGDFSPVWDEIRRAGYEKSLTSGIVPTGGGAIPDGMPKSPSRFSIRRSARLPVSVVLPTTSTA